jgi:hypothetical protein
MDREKILIDRENMYLLSVDCNGTHYLEVVCGGVAMERFVMPLSRDELKQYKLKGKSYLDRLSFEVCKEKDKFSGRFI